MVPTGTKQSNPLAMFMRQPKIFIRLPSNGEFWPPGSLEKSETGEYPVFSMTAKDELMLKVPDALMNGQAVVEVIQHCIPNIKNAWHLPNLDLDVLLIAIRIATYGEKMNVPVNLGEDLEFEYELNLNMLLDQLYSQITWETAVPISPDLTIHIRPLNYKQMTASALKTFETQRLIEIASSTDMPEADKVKSFNESFNKLNGIAIGIVNQSVFAVETSAGSTDNPDHIKEFMEQVDKEVYERVKKRVEELRDNNNIKPLQIPVNEEMASKGIKGETIEVPLTFDPTTFFG